VRVLPNCKNTVKSNHILYSSVRFGAFLNSQAKRARRLRTSVNAMQLFEEENGRNLSSVLKKHNMREIEKRIIVQYEENSLRSSSSSSP